MKKLIAALALVAMLSPHESHATNYHASKVNSPSDSNTGLDATHPWATIQKACHVLVAGDTLWVHRGTYLQTRCHDGNCGDVDSESNSQLNSRSGPALATTNSGTLTNPIVFKVWPGDSVNIQYDPGETGKGPLIGSNQRDYVIWDGFIVTETAANYQSDTGPVAIFGDSAGGAPATINDGSAIKNCDIRCTQIVYPDNHCAIRVENTDGVSITGNHIRGIGDGWTGGPHNHALIIVYGSTRLTIEKNEFNDAVCGVFIKGGCTSCTSPYNNDQVVIRYNFIHDVQVGVRTSFTLNTKIYQNVIKTGLVYQYSASSEAAIEYAEECTGGTSSCLGSVLNTTPTTVANRDAYNNTIYNFYHGILISDPANRWHGSGNDWRSNIMYGCTRAVAVGPTTDLLENLMNDVASSDYNDGFTSGNTAIWYWSSGSPQAMTLAQWRTATGKDLHSFNVDPQFVSPAANNFRLKSTSPLLNQATDFGDLDGDGNTAELINPGAYVTGNEQIGIIPPPSSVTSYFVPQAGPLNSPNTLEGAAAIAYAVTCPNNDLLNNAARLKVVLASASGAPLPGIPAADIYVAINGGTASQGFTGAGDDTLYANSTINSLANCPDLRRINANAATDAAGTTYIYWKGPNGQRDATRKWGMFAGDLPVFAQGVQLQGRLTTLDANGTYTAHVKNLDIVGSEAANQGEVVNALDFNPVQAAIGGAYVYQYDFNNDGVVDDLDLAFIRAHSNHRCNYPLNP